MSREGDAFHGGPATPDAIRRAPGYLARRLHQAYTAAHPGRDQGSLAHTVALDRSTMADVCRRLEERGLIERTQAPADGRRKLLGLTEDGRQALSRVHQRVLELEGELMADHGTDITQLLGHLDSLSRRWETVASGPSA
jgi:DNA-binding MarR family transcriptional regulator